MSGKWQAESYARDAYRLADKRVIKSLKAYSFGNVVWGAMQVWAQVAVAWGLLFIDAWLGVISFVVLVAVQQQMASWVHESSHHNLFRDQQKNDLWCNFFFGAPIGMNVASYRRNHLTHHMYLSDHDDLDRVVHEVDLNGSRLWIEFLKSLTGYYGVRVVMMKYLPSFLGGRAPASSTEQNRSMLPFLGMAAFWNCTFLSICFAAGHWHLYFALWIFPLFTIAQFINIVRTSAEHQPDEFPDVALEDQPIVRTTLPSAAERWLMYGVNFNYHVEHHLWPHVPFFNLPKLHAHLVEQGFYKMHPEMLQRSGLTAVWRRSRNARNAGQAEIVH